MRVADIMRQPVVVVREHANLEEVARVMLERDVGCVPVVGVGGALVGIITESDLTGKEKPIPFAWMSLPAVFDEWIGKDNIEEIYAQARTKAARDAMTRQVQTAREHDSITDVAVGMIARDLRRIPIVRDGIPVGIVTRHDLLRLFLPRAETGSATRSS